MFAWLLLALLGNFVLVPLLAFGITKLIPLDQSLQIRGDSVWVCRRGALHPQAR